MLAKAAMLPADEVFLDLEDSVAPQEKNDQTRQNVVDALLADSWVAKTRVVRINGVNTRWWLRDLVYVVERAAGSLDCVMLPKVEEPSQVHAVDHVLSQLETELGVERPIGIEVQIESPRGLMEIERIAGASRRAETLIFGPGDFAASTGIPQLSVGAIDADYPADQWHYVLFRIVVTARAFGLQAIDGPYAQIRDGAGFEEVARRSRHLGFDGKWALHPDQIEPCNRIYSPTQSEYERAERMLGALAEANEGRIGAVMFEGEMIDGASRKMAEGIAAKGRAAELEQP
jgi:citrate lyase subunit beta / citryl-CoA lyase